MNVFFRLLLASLLFALSTAWPTTAAPQPNIVVLLADDMRWDAMSCVATNTVILFTSDNGHFAGEHGPKPPLHIEPCEGVRTRDWKYCVWVKQTGPAHEELYDLRADPLEMKNLAAEPAAAAKLEELGRRHADLAQSAK